MSNNGNFDYLFKLLLMGDSGVGKSCLLFRFSDDAFQSTYISTTGIDFKIKTIDLDGKRIKLQIWDTAGQERFRTITKSYYRGAMGIMLVYDITSFRTFENVKNWIRDIEEHANLDVQKLVVGNKCDMEKIREVSIDKGQEISREYEMEFIEASAKANINVDAAFHKLARSVMKQMKDGPPSLSTGIIHPVPVGKNNTRRSGCC